VMEQMADEYAGAVIEGKDLDLQTVAQHQCVLPLMDIDIRQCGVC
jgi:hypothetical protein